MAKTRRKLVLDDINRGDVLTVEYIAPKNLADTVRGEYQRLVKLAGRWYILLGREPEEHLIPTLAIVEMRMSKAGRITRQQIAEMSDDE